MSDMRREDGIEKPKRPKTAFMIFAFENRAWIKQQNPGLRIIDLAKLMGTMWKEMSGEEKQPYTAKADLERERYNREMELYRSAVNSLEGSDAT
jgi:structure-specific recognition protein 1